MSIIGSEAEKHDGQLRLFESTDRITVENFDFVSIDTESIKMFARVSGERYLKNMIDYGKEVADCGRSFRSEFEIAVAPTDNVRFVNTMKAEGYTVISNSIPPTCDVYHEDISTGGGGNFGIACESCGGIEAHFDCETTKFWDHADHDCFSACCNARHGIITEQNFLNTTPLSKTYIEEGLKSDNPGLKKIVYNVTHYRLSVLDRLRIAHQDFADYQASLCDA